MRRPHQRSPRIRMIDIVRGTAVLGVFITNVPDMAYPEQLVLDFRATSQESAVNFWTGFLLDLLFSDKMRGLFTIVFGISIAIIFDGAADKGGYRQIKRSHLRRMFWLFIFGMVNAYLLLWWAEILAKYAVMGVLLLVFIRLPIRFLLITISICFSVLIAVPLADYHQMSSLRDQALALEQKDRSGEGLTETEQNLRDNWLDNLEDMHPDQEAIEEEIQAKTGSYSETFDFISHRALEEQTTIFLREDLWDMLLYMALGIILYRIGFFDPGRNQHIYLPVGLAAFAIGLSINAWVNLGLVDYALDPVRSRFRLVFFDLGRLPFVMGYLCLICYTFGLTLTKRIGDWMALAGRMSLSNYIIQSIIGAMIFYGIGLSQFNQWSRIEIALLSAAVGLMSVVWGVFWMRRFLYGPFEWLIRSLAAQKAQPIKRGAQN